MNLKELITTDCNDWPKEQMMSDLKEKKEWMSDRLYDLFVPMNGFDRLMHGWVIKSIEYINPECDGLLNPCLSIDIYCQPEKITRLLVSQLYDIQLVSKRELSSFSPSAEEIDTAYIQLQNGLYEMIITSTYGLTLYYAAKGVDIQEFE